MKLSTSADLKVCLKGKAFSHSIEKIFLCMDILRNLLLEKSTEIGNQFSYSENIIKYRQMSLQQTGHLMAVAQRSLIMQILNHLLL